MDYRRSLYYIIIFFAMLMTIMLSGKTISASEDPTPAASNPTPAASNDIQPADQPPHDIHPQPDKAATKAWEGLHLAVMPVFETLDQTSDASKELASTAITRLKNFVWQYPDAPEAIQAYYLLGRFHMKTGYTSEGRAYLQLLSNKYPDSHWTSEALLTLLQSATDEADKRSVEVFLQSLMKRHPDSLASKASWIYLTLLQMKAGEEKNVANELSKIEQEDPQFYLKVPAFLDIKARLLVKQGKEAEARDAWLMYLNQVKDNTLKPEILFQVAESLYRDGKQLEAENYYNLLSLKYSQSKEGAFANVRLAELVRFANDRFKSAGVREGKLRPNISTVIQEDAYRRVIEKTPKHYLASVAYQQFIKLRTEQDRLRDAMNLAQEFDEKIQESKAAQTEIDLLIDQAISRIGTKKTAQDFAGALEIALDLEKRWGQKPHFQVIFPVMEGILKAVKTTPLDEASCRNLIETGMAYLKAKPGGGLAGMMESLTVEAWQKLVKELQRLHAYKQATEEAYKLLVSFPASRYTEEIITIGRATLAAFDNGLIEGQDGISLLNFHFEQPERTTFFTSPEHLYYLGRAWQMCWAMDAAMLEFHRAWSEAKKHNHTELKNRTLVDWLQTAWDAGDNISFENLLVIASEDIGPTSPFYKKMLDFRIIKARQENDWRNLAQNCENVISLLRDPKKNAPYAAQLFEANIALKQWDRADDVLKTHVRSFSPDEQTQMLYSLGDAVLLNNEDGIEMAYEAYKRAEKIRPDTPEAISRKALVLFRNGKTSEAAEMINSINGTGYENWKKTFAAIEKSSEQIKKLDEDIKQLVTR